jgi:hypothetical protein
MIEININDSTSELSEFKVEKSWYWNDVTKVNEKTYTTLLSISKLTKEKSLEIKKIIQGDLPTKAFGRFDFNGDVSFNINNFYVNLFSVACTSWKYDKDNNEVKISFKALDGFGYSSCMGLSVIRDQKLNAILS